MVAAKAGFEIVREHLRLPHFQEASTMHPWHRIAFTGIGIMLVLVLSALDRTRATEGITLTDGVMARVRGANPANRTNHLDWDCSDENEQLSATNPVASKNNCDSHEGFNCVICPTTTISEFVETVQLPPPVKDRRTPATPPTVVCGSGMSGTTGDLGICSGGQCINTTSSPGQCSNQLKLWQTQ